MCKVDSSTYLLLGLELIWVEAVQQQGKKQIQNHEIAHDQSREKDGETGPWPLLKWNEGNRDQWR